MSTLGEKFAPARQEKGVTQSKAAAATRMKIQHVQAMEQDDFSSMAAPAYAKGFIKLYAEYLGLDHRPLIQEYLERHAPPPPTSLISEDTQGTIGKHFVKNSLRAWDYLKKMSRRRRLKLLQNTVLGVVVFTVIILLISGLRSCPEAELLDDRGNNKLFQDLGIMQDPPDPYLEEP